jgi:hypothetical protein
MSDKAECRTIESQIIRTKLLIDFVLYFCLLSALRLAVQHHYFLIDKSVDCLFLIEAKRLDFMSGIPALDSCKLLENL